MTRFSDAALLKGDFAHMASEFRAGNRAAPKKKDWRKAACDNQAEEAAQEIAKHIFALQQDIDPEKEALEITTFTAAGPMKVMGLLPGEGDIIRIDGVLPNGNPIAHVVHATQLALTFTKAVLKADESVDDGLDIGFVIFEELKERKKKRAKKAKKLSLSTSRTIKAPAKKAAPKKKA